MRHRVAKTMPINFQEIYQQIQAIGKSASERRKTLEERRKLARELLAMYSEQLDFLRRKVDMAREADQNIRCAVPLDESLASSYPPPASVIDATLIAADGSQSIADRHDSIQFCVINVGAIIMRPRSGVTSEIYTETELYYGDAIEDNGLTTDGGIALKRDLHERSVIETLSKDLQDTVVSFTDGTIELFRARDLDNSNVYQQTVSSFLSVLSRLQSRGVITAGYIDKPSSNLVIRLLELASASIPDDLEKLRNTPPLKHITDRWLFGFKNSLFQLLPPGHRSAVFKIQSGTVKNYTGVLSLHFFYLNVGTEGHPWPVRVEIPGWIVEDKEKLGLLHCILLEQCQVMGSRPYPYLLHRAHEIAVVRNEEKEQIKQLLTMELCRNEEDIDDGSYKQSAKDLKGRSRR